MSYDTIFWSLLIMYSLESPRHSDLIDIIISCWFPVLLVLSSLVVFPCNLVYLMILIKFEIYRKLKLYSSLIPCTSKNVRYKNNFNHFSPSSVRCPFFLACTYVIFSVILIYFVRYLNRYFSIVIIFLWYLFFVRRLVLNTFFLIYCGLMY